MDHRQILTFVLHEELGHDRLGRVFHAVDTRTQRPVVVRLLRVTSLVPAADLAATRTELRRILRTAATVAHPNLANIVDVGSWEDLEVVSWDDAGGVPLSDRLAEAPVVEALRWAVETTSAVARAHIRNVPHGRVTMANLVVARDDSVRVLDLGIPRPWEIPFLIDQRADGPGRVMRQDVTALARVVREILAATPAEAPDRARILSMVEAAVAVADHPRASAASLHRALVDVARQTPAISGGRFPDLAGPVDPRPEEPVAASEPPPDDAEPLPFSLSDYRSTGAHGGPGGSPAGAWGSTAFEASPPDPEEERAIAAPPAEPPVMRRVLLVPGPEDHPDSAEAGEDRPPVRRPGLMIAASVLLGMAIAVGLFALQNAGRADVRAPDAASDVTRVPAPVSPGGPTATLTGGPPPEAPPGQPSGTLVVSTSDSGVRVSVDGSRPENAPVTWERIPIGRRVVRVFRADLLERVDTVDVRASLTTTRYYVLGPAAR